MPGPGEFKIFNDTLGGAATPLVTRQGIKTFDKKIKGAPAFLGHDIASQPIADQSFGTIMGLFQKCVGIQWLGGKFTVAGGGSDASPGAPPFPIALLNGAVRGVNIAFNTATGDKTGIPGQEGATVVEDTRFGTDPGEKAGSKNGGTMYVGIRGTSTAGKEIWMAGGFTQEAADAADNIAVTSFCTPPPGGLPIPNGWEYVTPFQTFAQSPVVLMSMDNGRTWTDMNIPRAGPIVDGVNKVLTANVEVNDGDCVHSHIQIFPLNQYSNLNGSVTALAFDPNTHLFWATVAYVSDNNGYSVQFYTSSDGGGWSAAGGADLGMDIPSKAPLPPWPKDTKVNDGTVYFNSNPAKIHPPNISHVVKYAAVNAPGQTMDLGDGKTLGMRADGSFTGINAPGVNNNIFNSACGGGQLLAVAQWGGFDGPPQIFFSTDQGQSFNQILPSFSWAISGIHTVSFS